MDHAARLVVITGGARSGKSRFAVHHARTFGRRIAYLATCAPDDAEMRGRVERHRRERPAHWRTVEHPPDLIPVLERLRRRVDGILLDCLTLYVAERVTRGDSHTSIQRHVRRLCRAMRAAGVPVLVVTNEVGSSVVPDSALGRRFRDEAGSANQTVAACADAVVYMVAGLPLWLKGGARR